MSKTSRRNVVVSSAFVALACAASCTSASSGSIDATGTSAGGGTSTFGDGGASGSSDVRFDGGTGGTLSSGGTKGGGGTVGAGGGDLCGGEVSKAMVSQLDLYLMVDQSGSMTEPTNGGGTKWEALTSALSTFLSDSGTSGLGVGVQFFPFAQPGVPELCTTGSNDCGPKGGMCQGVKICDDGLPTPTQCMTDNDCSFGACLPVGKCSKLGPQGTPLLCFYGQPQQCSSIDGNFGKCQGPVGQCTGAYSCDAGDYSAPDAPIATLPGARDALIAKLNAHTPKGDTPTAAALQGALDYATTWAKAHPDHTVAVLLATDGLPSSSCSTNDIGQIAAEASKAAAGMPKIATFVIGIFNDVDLAAGADKTLDTIADAGGTGQKAFIVKTNSGDASMQLLAALDAVRKASLACTYTLPATDQNGGAVQYDKVNLVFSSDAKAMPTTVAYVGDVSHCDATTGGWYYDVDPAKGAPTKILTCPATCGAFRMASLGEVGVQLRCPTQTTVVH